EACLRVGQVGSHLARPRRHRPHGRAPGGGPGERRLRRRGGCAPAHRLGGPGGALLLLVWPPRGRRSRLGAGPCPAGPPPPPPPPPLLFTTWEESTFSAAPPWALGSGSATSTSSWS